MPGDLWADFLLYCRSHSTLTMEEWENDLPSFLLIPLHRTPNLSGWIARQASKRKLIEKSGTMEVSQKKGRRGAMIHRWSSLLYKPPGRSGGAIDVG